ncbi:unnamed protein product, partial [Rotaria magnacalcarata]
IIYLEVKPAMKNQIIRELKVNEFIIIIIIITLLSKIFYYYGLGIASM